MCICSHFKCLSTAFWTVCINILIGFLFLFFLGGIVELFHGTSMIAVRSIVSKIASNEEIGEYLFKCSNWFKAKILFAPSSVLLISYGHPDKWGDFWKNLIRIWTMWLLGNFNWRRQAQRSWDFKNFWNVQLI